MTFAGAARRWWRRVLWAPRPIPDALWQRTLGHYPFLARLPQAERLRLRRLATFFLAEKEFTGTHGLRVGDAMATAVAAQACLLLLHLGPPDRPEAALRWYDDFVGIVMYPTDAVAHRERVDHAGVVHHYDEMLAGETMPHGPVMLSWPAVKESGAEGARSVVIHEFAHKLDMRGGRARGAPPLPGGFMGTRSAAAAQAAWGNTWSHAYRAFRREVRRAESLGEPLPWLDAYGATAPAEFFAVACEAYFVESDRFAEEFPELNAALTAFFRPGSAS
ncbi:MAG: zinc-dependent peptidase [Burkholderiaceae bacterium]|nr:MAG: zinc-dependent peptidase [Burkholderiaceae bacterium]